MSWQNVAPLFRGQGPGAPRGDFRSTDGTVVEFLTAVVERTIIPRRHQIRANGRMLDIFARDRKIIAFRRYDEQGNSAFRLVGADAGREVAMPFMWALAGMGGDISENELSVHRLTDEDRDALPAGKALGLSVAELQLRAAQATNPTARSGAANETSTASNVVTFEKAAADRLAEQEPPREPPPAPETRGNAADDAALGDPGSPAGIVAAPASPEVGTSAIERQPTLKITRLGELLREDTREVAHRAFDGSIHRPLGSLGDFSDADLSALHTQLAAWNDRIADTAMPGAKLICALGPDRDSDVMVCTTDGAHSVYAEIRLARMGLLIGQWTQLEAEG